MFAIADSPRFLRAVLWADAASCAAIALLHLMAAPALESLLGLPAGLLVASGLVLVGVIALAGYLASCDPIPRTGVGLLVAGNAAWVLACVALLAGGVASTPLGQAYLAAQALSVALIAELEWLGLRRQRTQAFA